MVSGKNRLYIALYPSGVVDNEERRYHWGFLIGPKIEHNKRQVSGKRIHVKNSHVYWEFEEKSITNVKATTNLLARILIAKIGDDERLLALFRRIPIVQGDPNWRCRTWVENALNEISRDGKCVGTEELDWQKIEPLARRYVGEKIEIGRYRNTSATTEYMPLWDMLQNKEILP